MHKLVRLADLRTQLTKPCTRPFSTTRPTSNAPSRPFMKASRFTRLLGKETGDPIWRLVENLNTSRRLASKERPYTPGIVHGWEDVIAAVDISEAMALLAKRGYAASGVETGTSAALAKPLPSWLVLYIACSKVRTPAHASGPLIDLVFTHLDAAKPDIQGSILIMTVVALARFHMLVPIRRVVQNFLMTTLTHPDLQFNLLLQALSSLPSSAQAADQVVTVLKAMKSRQIKLQSNTYKALLSDRFVTMQLTTYLRQRMVQEGFVPQADHLEAYLRVFAKNGSIHDAQKYFNAVREDAIRRKARVPIDPKSFSPDDPHTGVPHRANTLLIAAQSDRASAFEYLAQLLKAQTQINASSPDDDPIRLPRLPRSSGVKHPRLHGKKSIDVYDWTAALAAAADDHTTSVQTLVRLFERARTKTKAFRPTVVTYTVLIRGLYRRHVFSYAEEYWNQLLATGLTIDRNALTIGLQVLTRAGKPHQAIALLESFAARADTALPAPFTLRSPVIMDTHGMNELFLSLELIERPDVVFQLWEYMGDLYGVAPNSISLDLMLRCARMACRMDDSASGTFARLALRNPFRKPKPRASTRAEAIAAFAHVVGDPTGKVRPYFSGVWDDMLAPEKARNVFHQVILGNRPDLAEVKSPAHAIRASGDGRNWSPLADLAQGMGLPSNLPKPTPPFSRPNSTGTGGRSTYPEIVLSESNFFNYILLLGTSSEVTEIPMVLAWMRALGVLPSKTTLAAALIFWAEVSMQAPLIEQWTGGAEKSQYERLVRWITGWVGQKGLPSGQDFGTWLKRIEKMRDGRQ